MAERAGTLQKLDDDLFCLFPISFGKSSQLSSEIPDDLFSQFSWKSLLPWKLVCRNATRNNFLTITSHIYNFRSKDTNVLISFDFPLVSFKIPSKTTSKSFHELITFSRRNAFRLTGVSSWNASWVEVPERRSGSKKPRYGSGALRLNYSPASPYYFNSFKPPCLSLQRWFFFTQTLFIKIIILK